MSIAVPTTSPPKSNNLIGFLLLFLGIALVLLGVLYPPITATGSAVVVTLGTVIAYTGLALIAGWPLVCKIIDKALKIARLDRPEER